MPQRILALDIMDSDLKATVLQTTFRDYRVAGFYRESVAANGGPAEEQVTRFIRQHLEAGDTVLSVVPGTVVTWRTLFLPFRDRKKLEQTIPFELESSVPLGLDDVVLDYQVLHRDRAGTTVLAALVPKEDLERHLDLLKRSGVDPKVVDLGPLATLNTLTLVPELPSTFVFLDVALHTVTVALYREGDLAGLRTVAHGDHGIAVTGNGVGDHGAHGADSEVEAVVREVTWTLVALNGAPLDDPTPCYVAGAPGLIAGIEQRLAGALPVTIRRLDRLSLRNLAPDARANAAGFSSSLGAALREVTPANALGINFRRGEFAFHRSQQELRRALRGVAALAALVVALTVADLYMEYRQLTARLVSIDGQIQAVFENALRDVDRLGNPATQLQDEINALRAEVELLNGVVPVGGLTSVDVMRAVAAAVPNRIRIDSDEYLMDRDTVRLRANTDTFESVDAIKQRLIDTGFFGDVQVKDAKAGKDGSSVDFRMTLVLRKELRPRGEGQ